MSSCWLERRVQIQSRRFADVDELHDASELPDLLEWKLLDGHHQQQAVWPVACLQHHIHGVPLAGQYGWQKRGAVDVGGVLELFLVAIGQVPSLPSCQREIFELGD